MADQNRIVVTSQISTRLQRSRQQVSNPVSSIIHGATHVLHRARAHLKRTFKCARARCKTCPFIRNVEKISGPKRSIKITDHFTCTSANVIYCITCTLCKKLYISETGRRLGDRFREHLRDVEKDDQNASKPVARHFNLPVFLKLGIINVHHKRNKMTPLVLLP